MNPLIQQHASAIADFCRKWNVQELSLFGSVLRDDFGPDSDIDVLVSFQPGTKVFFRDLDDMERELKEIFSREVDLLTRASIEQSPNYLRRKSILEHMETIYRAA